ncbi:MAG: DUF2279 domain-containing protein [Flavobacteriales bacterium]|nr:DUF2279 domain-containing protein [Flavobacteriales bacterium]
MYTNICNDGYRETDTYQKRIPEFRSGLTMLLFTILQMNGCVTKKKITSTQNSFHHFHKSSHQNKKITLFTFSQISKTSLIQKLLVVTTMMFVMAPLFGQQEDSTSIFRKRKWVIGSSTALAAGTSYYLLNDLWYKNYARSSFHFFNDNNEWLQMDKVGHGFTTYTTGRYMCDALRWSGASENISVWLGGTSGLIYLSGIEIMDGKSKAWGFSYGDMIANASGSFLFIVQEKIFREQRITLKFSYSESDFAMLNSDQLGRNFQQRVLKDYNAQTYWASINVHSFLASDADFPRWLNVAFGYGAMKMTHAEMNDFSVNNFQREREFYFSFDADLNRVRWKKKWMRTTAKILSFIKIPTPTFEMRSGGQTKFHWMFF